MPRIGIDLGGTKIEGLLLDDDGSEVRRQRVATPAEDYQAIVRAIAQLVSDLAPESTAASIGIGIPGTLSPNSGLVKNANTTSLIGKKLDDDLATALGQQVRIANDANCFALSEATDGAASGASIVFGVIIGTGTGGGVVCNGEVIIGANSITGEWGHNPLPWPTSAELPGPDCYCGRQGCIETFLSGPALQRDYGEKQARAEYIVTRAGAGEKAAVDTLERYCHRLARSLASVINVLDPDVIVLGGGLSNLKILYERVPQLWAEFVFSDAVATRLLPARHGDSSGVRGAAWLWPL